MSKKENIKNIIKKKIEITNTGSKVLIGKAHIDNYKEKKIRKEPLKVIPNKIEKSMNDRLSQRSKIQKKDITVHVNSTRLEQRAGANMYNTPTNFSTKYLRKDVSDYDVVIVISSFDRFEKVKRILTQLDTQNSKYSKKVVLLNDGSVSKEYDTLQNIFPNLEYIKNPVNNGRDGYWKSLTTLFRAASKYDTYAICQIDDDYYLCDEFINNVMDEFFKIKNIDNRYVSVYYHKTAQKNNEVVDIHRVDGGVLFDYNYLKHIGFEVKQTKVSSVGSGVWRYLTTTIKQNNCFSYRLNYSLVKHDGNEDSKMHKQHRDESPIYSYHFKDDIIK